MRSLVFVVAVSLLSVGLSGCDDPQAKPAPAAPPPMPVKVSAPLVKPITEWDEYTGRFEAVESVEVRARVSGYLDQRNFTDGQMVEKGQLLFVIDPRPYEAAVERAKAELQRMATRLELTGQDLARAEKLMGSNAISREDFDTKRQARREMEAAMASNRAALRQAELDLEFTQIRSPIRGRISDRKVDVGNLVSGGTPQSTLLTTIVSVDPIHFVFDVSEADFLRYKRLGRDGQRDAAQPVDLKLADETQWSRHGRLNFVDNELNTRSGTIRLRAQFDNGDGFLTPGLFGRLRIAAGAEHEAMLVPDAAVASDQARKLLLAVKDDGTVVGKPVTLGPVVDGLRVIRNGIEPGERIIIEGVQRARPGGRVAPQPGQITVAAQR